MKAGAPLAARFGARFEAEVRPACGSRVVVGLSGGLDSCVLLHLLRFSLPDPPELVAAHFDHALRPESGADARWVTGLCSSWGVALRVERTAVAPASEASARALRYAFLESVRAGVAAGALLTAHHADDQAETVLFRALRGTGIGGLTGIPRRRGPYLFRPLLDFWRKDLEAYAREVGLAWREDASNDALTFARNALRHRILPDAERLVAPGARRALVRLSRLASADEAAWASQLDALLEPLAVAEVDEGLTFDAQALRRTHPAIQARLLRALAARRDATLDEAATRRALAFVERGPSGRRVDLGGGLALRRDLDRLALVPWARDADARAPDQPLCIPDAGPGTGEALLGGRVVRALWGAEHGDPVGGRERFAVGPDAYPMVLRGPRPGDRVRLDVGTKKLKKLLLEARIPRARRARIPVLVDARGEVLWVVGVARARSEARGGGETLSIGIES